MTYNERKQYIETSYQQLVNRVNEPLVSLDGLFQRYRYPVITAEHIPLTWRYDFSPKDNPYLLERIGVNAVFNAGAIYLNGKYLLVCRVEGKDRKSYFAVAESDNGVDHFHFWDRPITMPEWGEVATNIYDMRLTQHEDGWIYGLFCVERHDPAHPEDLSAATATCGIARTHDLKTWERLDDLVSSSQQRNVVLHPEFIRIPTPLPPYTPTPHYALYTRPQEGFIEAGNGGGIGWALVEDITHAVITHQTILDARYYHTIKEAKNGEGPHPIKTPQGWLHLAHGVRNCASGLRYVLYCYMTALDEPWREIAQPAGYLLAPQGEEYVGDVMNVCFSNGWIEAPDGRLLIYYASSDTRLHVAQTTVEQLVDYCLHTPQDGWTTSASVRAINHLIDKNEGH